MILVQFLFKKLNGGINMENIGKPEGYHTLTPVLIVQGAKEAIKFYEQVFGAKVQRIFNGPDDTIVHAELKMGDSMIMLSDEFPMMQVLSPKSPGGTGSSLYFFVDDVDKVFNDAVNAGAETKMALMDAFWGDRCGTIIDPFGHTWTLAKHIKDVSDEEIERLSKESFNMK